MIHLNSNVLRKMMRRQLRHLVMTSRVTILLIACLHAKANVLVGGAKKNHWQNPRSLSIANPKSKAVILFLHGSVVDKLDDTCDPNGDTPGFSVPDVVRDLAGTQVAGLEMVVLAPCHGRATQLGEPLKIDQRVQAIEQTLQELARSGVGPSRIFLVGQSAGGWAALLHQKRHPDSVNAIIAFAPAFAGKKRWRPDNWQQRHEEQSAELMSAKRIPALVFAFENDEYNTPEDLAFLTQIQGTTVLRMPEKAIAGVACEIPFFSSSHSQAYRACFTSTQSDVLVNFLREHLSSEVVADSDPPKINTQSETALLVKASFKP